MQLRERFTEELKTAMKGGAKARISTIRMIQAALKDKDIEARGLGKGPISDEEIMALLQKMTKQRQESIAIYDANDRPELAAQEREEALIIAGFLPQQLGEAEMTKAVADAIAATGAGSVKDMGRVIGKLRAEYAGRMDFARASALVKERLSAA